MRGPLLARFGSPDVFPGSREGGVFRLARGGAGMPSLWGSTLWCMFLCPQTKKYISGSMQPSRTGLPSTVDTSANKLVHGFNNVQPGLST